jgi:hypothetical protein
VIGLVIFDGRTSMDFQKVLFDTRTGEHTSQSFAFLRRVVVCSENIQETIRGSSTSSRIMPDMGRHSWRRHIGPS